MDLLFLPPEILLEIFQYLDYRALIDVRQACKALHGVMNTELFWMNLAREQCSKPGIGKLVYPLGNYSIVELMRWTLRRLRIRDRWASSSEGAHTFQFRSRLITGGRTLYGAELLRGGRWLLTMRLDGTAYMLDLEKESSPQPQFLFDSHNGRRNGSGEGPLVKFRIWIDETQPELLFRVATYPGGTTRKGPVYIYQIHCVGQGPATSLAVTLITIIQDPRPGVRSWTALSERYFLQCFALPAENGQGMSTALQLHRCSQDLQLLDASDYVETRVETNGLTKVFFLPGDRVLFVAPTFTNIYATNLDQDSTLPKLVLLHHVPILQTPSLLSTPFFGSHSTFLVSTHAGMFRSITINHDCDHTSSPAIVIEELGNLNTLIMLSSDVMFGPSASIIRSRPSKLEIVSYEYGIDRHHFRRKCYDSDLLDDFPLPARYLAGFDDSVGRVVLRSDSTRDELMILDLI